MDWSRAKNISIFAFLLLNSVLMFLLYLDSRQYVLGADNQRAITQVLANNGIALGNNFEFLRNDPRQPIALADASISQNNLAAHFMVNNSNISITPLYGGVTFHNDYEEVTFNEGRAHYRNIANKDLYLPTLNDKRRYATYVITSLGDAGRYFVLDTTQQTHNGFILAYREAYRNNIVYSNFIIFTFEDSNIAYIDFSLTPAYGFAGGQVDIRPVDEVLLTFMRNVSHDTIVQSMDMVYNANGLTAVPYYRITYTTQGATKTMLINAVTNTVGD